MVNLPDDVAEAALRAAVKAGYKKLVQDLINAGVRADSCNGAALVLAAYYGHSEIEKILRRPPQ